MKKVSKSEKKMKPPLSSSSPVMMNQIVRKSRTISTPFIFTLIAFIIFVVILYGQDFACTFSSLDHSQHLQTLDHSSSSLPSNFRSNFVQLKEKKKKGRKEKKLPFAVGKTPESCNIFEGEWVRDDNRPLYEERECPYIQPQLTCQEHGRPDTDYQKWRWQPRGCDLPKFNATLMLEALRGKRMLFVGDSLNRGQYISLICLLHRLVPEDRKVMEGNFSSLTAFRLKDFNAVIEFYWAPFLLESNSDDAVVHRIKDRIVRKGSINTHGEYWKGADIVVFNTYLWWMTGLEFKILKGSFQDEEKEIEELSTEDAYRMAMKSMLKWIQRNMDPKKTRVFFTSMSPTHSKSIDWGGENGGNCYNQTTPIEDPQYWGSDSRKSIMKVIGEEFSKTKVPISFLNITQLSSYRRDAHTQIYKKQWSPLTPEQKADPKTYADCVHWCLPGLQDTWNELLYAKLFYP